MPRIHRVLRHLIAAIAMLSMLTSCSLATIAYNNADTLIGYALRDYVELNVEQEIWLKERITLLMAWHRSNELPQWQRWLTEARERAAGMPETSDLRATYVRGQALLARTTAQALPDLAKLLHQLEPAQIAFLENKFANDNRKLAKDIAVALPTRYAKRADDVREGFEGWLGSLTPEQAAYLQARATILVPMEEMRLADRRRWQRELIELVKARPELPTLEAELRSWILSPEKYRDPVYQAEMNRQYEAMLGVTAWMVTNATPQQKLRVQKKLSGYAEDIARLLRN